ncbi:MAG TPA: MFS transporter [Solirubrobacterales bacterium]|nr:MFS transporter [Solirubrobacterales bacterium]
MAGTTQPIERGTWLALIAMGIAVFVIANDFSAINVAIPQIEEDFDTDVTTAQWVVNAYALTFGVLIVTGGRLADLFGRRRAFFIGTAIFATFSVLGGAAQSEAWLITMRVLMGIGGALMWPAILGMTYAALPEDRAGLAGGFILGAAGIGNAAGPLIGGALTDLLSWRWIFFLNLPVSAFAMFVTWRQIHQPRPEVEDTRIDCGGIVTVSVGLVALLLAFDQAIDWGWGDPRIIALVATFVILIAGFIGVERRAGEHALVPPDVIRNRDFAYTCAAILLMSAVFFAAMLYLPQLMIKVLDYSAIKAGAGMLPMLGTFAAVSFVAGPLYERFGPKILLIGGSLCIAVAPALIALLVGDGSGEIPSYGAIAPGMAILGLGIGLFYPTATTVGVTAVAESRRSLAGAIVYMFQIAGGSVGLGLTTTVFTEAGKGASSAAAGFIDGIEAAFAMDAAIAVGGFLIATFLIGGRPKLHRAAHRAAAGPSPRGHGP